MTALCTKCRVHPIARVLQSGLHPTHPERVSWCAKCRHNAAAAHPTAPTTPPRPTCTRCGERPAAKVYHSTKRGTQKEKEGWCGPCREYTRRNGLTAPVVSPPKVSPPAEAALQGPGHPPPRPPETSPQTFYLAHLGEIVALASRMALLGVPAPVALGLVQAAFDLRARFSAPTP